MAKRIFVFLRASKDGSVRSKSLGRVKHIDELRAEPGGHVAVVNGTFNIGKGQIVRFPSAFYMKDNIHRWPWLTNVGGFDAEPELQPAAEPVPEPEPEPEPAKKRGRPRKVTLDAD
jgi:hypothetical protein